MADAQEIKRSEEARKRRKRIGLLAAHAVGDMLGRHSRLYGRYLWEEGSTIRVRVNRVEVIEVCDAGRLAIRDRVIRQSWFLHCEMSGPAGEESLRIVRSWPGIRSVFVKVG